MRDIRVQTLIQMGEICIDGREYKKATKNYEKAGDAEPNITLYANFIRGRLRYLERQMEGPDPE